MGIAIAMALLPIKKPLAVVGLQFCNSFLCRMRDKVNIQLIWTTLLTLAPASLNMLERLFHMSIHGRFIVGSNPLLNLLLSVRKPSSLSAEILLS